VDPLTQVVVAGDAGGKRVKRGRKNEAESSSNKAQKVDNLDTAAGQGDVHGDVLPPPTKGTRSNRSRSSGPNAP
jgi:hypothetical protein